MNSLNEIHKIMEKIHNEEKGLTPEERVRRIREESEKFLKERKIHLKTVSPKESGHILR